MKLVKMTGLAVIAAVAAMAFMGVSSAMATTTVLCTENVLVCPEGKKIENAHIEATSVGSPELLSSTANVACTQSTILGEVLTLASPLVGHLSLLDFTNCTSGSFSCTVTTDTPLGLILLLKTASNLGTLQSHNSTVGISCGGGLLKCKFGGLPTLHAEGGNPGHVTAAGAELGVLKKEGFLNCPEKAFWDASYEITLPKPVFISE